MKTRKSMAVLASTVIVVGTLFVLAGPASSGEPTLVIEVTKSVVGTPDTDQKWEVVVDCQAYDPSDAAVGDPFGDSATIRWTKSTGQLEPANGLVAFRIDTDLGTTAATTIRCRVDETEKDDADSSSLTCVASRFSADCTSNGQVEITIDDLDYGEVEVGLTNVYEEPPAEVPAGVEAAPASEVEAEPDFTG